MILTPGVLLYHASYTAVENIDLSLCADGKDFGKGFYVTTDYNQAYKFVKTSILKAVKNGIKIENKTVGYISIYEFKQNQDLSIFEFAEADKQWLHCVAKHRKNTLLDNFSYNWNVYDIIVGKIANDTTNQVLALLKELNQKLGLTIIMISHQMNVIEKICNKVAIIKFNSSLKL